MTERTKMRTTRKKAAKKIPNALWWERIASFKDFVPRLAAQKIDFRGKKFVLINEAAVIPKEKRREYILLFFSDDSDFKKYYFNLQANKKLLRFLQSFYAVGGLDFSTVPGIDEAENIAAIKRNRRFCVAMQKFDALCIYNVVWTSPESYAVAFDNVESGSIVLVSTHCLSQNCMKLFENGYEEMKRRIKPSAILCYGKIVPCIQKDLHTGLVYAIPTRFRLKEFNRKLDWPTPTLFDGLAV